MTSSWVRVNSKQVTTDRSLTCSGVPFRFNEFEIPFTKKNFIVFKMISAPKMEQYFQNFIITLHNPLCLSKSFYCDMFFKNINYF